MLLEMASGDVNRDNVGYLILRFQLLIQRPCSQIISSVNLAPELEIQTSEPSTLSRLTFREVILKLLNTALNIQ